MKVNGAKTIAGTFFFSSSSLHRVWFLEISNMLPEAFREYKHFDEGLHRSAEIYTKANNDQMWHVAINGRLITVWIYHEIFQIVVVTNK